MSSEEQKNAFEKLLSDEDFLQGLAKKAAAQAKENETKWVETMKRNIGQAHSTDFTPLQ